MADETGVIEDNDVLGLLQKEEERVGVLSTLNVEATIEGCYR